MLLAWLAPAPLIKPSAIAGLPGRRFTPLLHILAQVFQTKCIMEDVDEHVEVTGDFRAFQRDHPEQEVAIDARFEDPQGHLVYERHGSASGEFHFVSGDEGEYKLCFTAKDYHTAQGTRIKMKWATGAEAHDWEAVAKKDNLNAIQVRRRRCFAGWLGKAGRRGWRGLLRTTSWRFYTRPGPSVRGARADAPAVAPRALLALRPPFCL
jgi:hypothetical protein